jgi:hypothetical protein
MEVATPAELSRSKKIKHIDCQTGLNAPTDTKVVSGAVANLAGFFLGLCRRWRRSRARTPTAPISSYHYCPDCGEFLEASHRRSNAPSSIRVAIAHPHRTPGQTWDK